MGEIRAAYKKREFTEAYNILLAVMLRLEELGVDFTEEIDVIGHDNQSYGKVNLRQRFYDLMRGDIVDDPQIRASYFKGATPYANHVWNLWALEQMGEPETLPADYKTGIVIKIVHIRSGDVMNYSDWFKVWNYLIRQLDLVVPKLERKILNIIAPKGMSVA